MHTNTPNPLRRKDLLLFAVLLAISLILLLVQQLTAKQGAQVVVHNGDTVYASFDLNTDTEYLIETEYGTNHLVIRDGYACINDADCSNRLCVLQGAISQAGEMIVCLPHEIVVEIRE